MQGQRRPWKLNAMQKQTLDKCQSNPALRVQRTASPIEEMCPSSGFTQIRVIDSSSCRVEWMSTRRTFLDILEKRTHGGHIRVKGQKSQVWMGLLFKNKIRLRTSTYNKYRAHRPVSQGLELKKIFRVGLGQGYAQSFNSTTKACPEGSSITY